MRTPPHQYIERATGKICNERLFGDVLVNWIYSSVRESAPRLFRALTSARASDLLGFLNFDIGLRANLTKTARFLENSGIDWSECADSPGAFKSLREVFERKIRYWECRPMPEDPGIVVSPADARVLVGSFSETSMLFLKDKFFDYLELLGTGKRQWLDAFKEGDFAIFRLTPEKYHYNHAPVDGEVLELYEISGAYHSCNPGAVVDLVTPSSKNKRVVAILDTDVPGGSEVGLVAMIEVVALMIGEVVQCYSEDEYRNPLPVRAGMFLKKGRPKSLYRPGSSTDILLFQKGRVRFCSDIIQNMHSQFARSRFSLGFGRPLVETDLGVRSAIAKRCDEWVNR